MTEENAVFRVVTKDIKRVLMPHDLSPWEVSLSLDRAFVWEAHPFGHKFWMHEHQSIRCGRPLSFKALFALHEMLRLGPEISDEELRTCLTWKL